MGVETGELGTRLQVEKSAGGLHSEIHIFQLVSFFLAGMFFIHFPTFQNKVAEIRGETKIWG